MKKIYKLKVCLPLKRILYIIKNKLITIIIFNIQIIFVKQSNF